MTRLFNWPDLLTQFIQSRKDHAFQWGKHDCCLFVADAILAITGVDKAAAVRGRYSTAIGAQRILTKNNYENIEHALTEILGTPVARLQVRRGDVVLVEHDGQDIAGVMYGQVVIPGLTKLETVSPLTIKTVWRVG